MDDPALAWPAWKFGMKRDALYTTLHDQYNTFQSTIQDPDAFHHDVCEIANEASTTAEFHRLLGARSTQRLRELNESLESASFEIIANPSLIGTTQWEFALQLFRTRSLDSLVRYFASYLPSEHPWKTDATTDLSDSTTSLSTASTSVSSQPFFDDGIITHEPMSIPHSLSHASLCHELPPSPRSFTTYSDDMETSSHQLYCLNTLTPARTLSYNADSESEQSEKYDDAVAIKKGNKGSKKAGFDSLAINATAGIPSDDECPSPLHDDDSSQSSGPDTPASMSDAEPDVAEIEVHDAEDDTHRHNCDNTAIEKAATVGDLATSAPEIASATSSPLHRRPLQSGFGSDASRSSSPLPISVRARHRSVSPSRPWPLVHAAAAHYPETEDGIDVNNHNTTGRAAGRPSRLGCQYSHNHNVSHNRTHSVNPIGRRRPGPGVEKTPLPRPMRTRLRERREAAASAAVDDRQRK